MTSNWFRVVRGEGEKGERMMTMTEPLSCCSLMCNYAREKGMSYHEEETDRLISAPARLTVRPELTEHFSSISLHNREQIPPPTTSSAFLLLLWSFLLCTIKSAFTSWSPTGLDWRTSPDENNKPEMTFSYRKAHSFGSKNVWSHSL